MRNSLRFRLALWTIAAVVISIVTIWSILSSMFTDYVRERYKSEMSTLAKSITAGVFFDDGAFLLESSPGDPRLNLPAGGRYWQFNPPGQEEIRSQSLWDTKLDPSRFEEDDSGFFKTPGPDGQALLVFETSAKLAKEEGGGGRNFSVYAAFPETEYRQAVDSFHAQLRNMAIIAGLCLMAAGLILVIAGLSPLDRLRNQVAGIRSGELRAIEEHGPNEVRPLVKEINELLEEREQALERARARASDLAHGLKTPLTVLSQLASDLPPETAELIIRQVDLIRQRADRQLQAARLGTEQMVATSLAEIANKLVHVLRPMTDMTGIQWTIDIADDLTVQTDPADLAEALGNIMDNAAKWTKSTVWISAHRDGAFVVLEIRDDGPGVDENAYDTILRRGGHLDDGNDSTGLGLAITNDIVTAYGGKLTLSRAEIGGLCVQLAFPSAQARPLVSPA